MEIHGRIAMRREFGPSGEVGESSEAAAQAEGANAAPGSMNLDMSIEMNAGRATTPATRRWWESLFWISACSFILFFGDSKRHFLRAVLYDPRVIQRPFFIACLCVGINTLIFLYLAIFVRHVIRDRRDFDLVAPGMIPAATLLGVMAFILFAVSLWPVWGFFIIPILWTFFMGLVVISPYLPPYTKKDE